MARGGRGSPARARRRRAEPHLNALVARGLTKRYGDVAAVDRLDLEIPPGTLFGFLGPNGAGKTTTIRMLLGLIFPTEGDVEVLGERVFDSDAAAGRALRRVGAMIEEPAFYRYLSGRRNLQYFARAAGPAEDRRARLTRVEEVLATVGLTQAATKKVKAYSQGMRQRLGIAMALLGKPDVLLLDEPTNGLDPQGMREVRVLLRRLADEGTTVFVSSHLLFEVEAICDRVGVLARGRLVADGPPGTLRAPATRFVVEVDDLLRAEAVLADVPGVAAERTTADSLRVRLTSPATASGVNVALVNAGVQVSALVPERDSLEDVFLDLVADGEGGAGPDVLG